MLKLLDVQLERETMEGQSRVEMCFILRNHLPGYRQNIRQNLNVLLCPLDNLSP